VLQLQQYLTSPARQSGETSAAILSLPDPLYQRLEARFRGSEAEIHERARVYLPFIREAAERAKGAGRYDLLDVGCGRGELLTLARDAGFSVRGIDSNRSMVAGCHQKGLDVDELDLRAFLLDCPAGDFRCVTLVHVVEHIHVAHLPALLVELKRVIAPGGRLVMEFPNIANVLTASNHFYVDYTHHRPLHAETVKLFCEAAGFSGVFSHGLHPADESERLRRLDASVPGAAAANETIDRLNDLLYGPRDVLVIAER
jgi:O-antigen chain-terminating methyltransferase